MGVLNGGPNLVKNGLVFCFDSANPNSYTGTGTSWNDIINLDNTATSVNGPVFTSSNQGSFTLDGTNDYFSTNYTTGFGTSSLTVSFWLSYTQSQLSGLFSKRIGAPSYEQLSIFIAGDANGNTTGTKIAINDFNNPASRNAITTNSYNDGLWHHVSLVRGTADNKLYIDSVLVNTTTAATPNLSTTSKLFFGVIGEGQSILGFYLKGNLSIIQLYNRALSAAEVLQNYNSTKQRFGR